MIQRKQSLYLLLMTIVCIIMLLRDFQLYDGTLMANNSAAEYAVSVSHTVVNLFPVVVFHTYNLVYCLIISALVSFISIFFYKKRTLQLRLTGLNFFFLILSISLMAYNYFQLANLEGALIQSTRYHLALGLPVILGIFNILAYRGIKKDMALLASVDRLR